ncbi:MAG: ribosome maturation factor RimM [Alcanivoracaceae bacterium]
MLADADALTVGKISAVYGVKGWVKVYSWTQPIENILQYQPWHLKGANGWEPVDVTGKRLHGKGIVVQLAGVTDRDQARDRFVGREIAVPRSALPALDDGDYYWRDLMGLRVRLDDGRDIGKVVRMLETGANDVLVVRGDRHSIDDRERLIPWVPDVYVTAVDAAGGWLTVAWDPDF